MFLPCPYVRPGIEWTMFCGESLRTWRNLFLSAGKPCLQARKLGGKTEFFTAKAGMQAHFANSEIILVF